MKKIESYLLLLTAILGLPLIILLLPVILWLRYSKAGSGPRIGVIVSNRWPYRLQYLRLPYDLAIWRAGGTSVTIAPSDLPRLDELINDLDGLIITGGEDIDPALYNGEPSAAKLHNPERDKLELEALKILENKNLPTLCICRGAQLLTVYYGGKLHAHDPHPEKLRLHASSLFRLAGHKTSISKGSRLYSIIEKEEMLVNSIHHQAASEVIKLNISATAKNDGCIEGVELDDNSRFLIGVQWHPELSAPFNKQQQKLFDALINAAKGF
ncbi:MAG: gamma-glutamyl-gamma-aminobutyrate hydrolase family protein [Lentisphaerae bacterium]|nr:gamma-glutamyl-gamma-aminobutyrate hydrolase family protein [Lentisphaerota bacterium]MCP4102660.1 gamma-glutamyl-gamma-aminobutyrate hydrolase family protein [Lentisphaerota bacterium]